MKNKINVASLIVIILALGGCGSSDGESSDGDSNENRSDTIELSGLVMDGYLHKAKVCLDLNLNSECDTDEPSTTTSSDGKYTLTINKDDEFNYPIIAKAIAGTTIDADNPTSAITKSYTLTSTVDKPEVISPLTTLIKGQVDKNSELSSLEAAILVSDKLDITSDSSKLFEDYVQSENNDATSKKLHEVSKVITNLIVDIEEKITSDLGISSISQSQRLGLNYLINDIVVSNIDIIAQEINDDKTINELSSEINIIVNSNITTQDDLDTAIETIKNKTIAELFSGKTLYTYDNSTVVEVIFSDDFNTLQWSEIINGTDSGTDSISIINDYKIETVTYNDGDTSTLTVNGSYDDYIVVLLKNDDGENTTRFYYNQDKGMEYYGLTPKSVTTKTILSDADWNSIEPIYTDATGDTDLSGLDITEIKMSQDDENFYINIKRAGLNFPTSDYNFFDYFLYFQSGEKVFAVHNYNYYNPNVSRTSLFNGRTNYGEDLFTEEKTVINTTNVNLQLVIPRNSNFMQDNISYSVTLTSGGYNGSTRLEGESEWDSNFLIKF